MAGVEEVLEGGVGVFGHAGLVGVSGVGLAEAAVVDGEDGEAGAVEEEQGGDGGGEGAGTVVEKEDGGRGRVFRRGAFGGNPPAGEAGLAGFGGIEVDEREGNGGGSCRRWRMG